MRAEVVTTARLSLRTASPGDFADLFKVVLSVPDLMRQVMSGKALSEEEALAFCNSKFDREGSGKGLGVLVERESNRVIGFAGLMPCDVLGELDFELGFVLARASQGEGYAQEIGMGQIDFGFKRLGCSRLLAQVSPGNPASIRTLQKIGMHWHSTIESESRGLRHVYVVMDT